jgi:hypothetical protein
MSNLCTLHPLLAFLLVILFRALLSDLLQIIDQHLHLVLPGLLVGLDVVDHRVDTLLGLVEVVLLGFFHVLFDGLGRSDSQVVLDDIDVLVDLGDLLVLV